MFVLCPHCHFLVGMDPRTGGPPAACPKCGGTVVEPVAVATPDAPVLDPFAEAALPSVAPTLPVAEPAAEAPADAKPARASAPQGAAVRGSEAKRAAAAASDAAPQGPAPPGPASPDAGIAEPAPADVAARVTTTRPSADEMIAAFSGRPARKPREPRTRAKKSPVQAATSTTGAEAGTPPPVVAPQPAPAPSAAASLGARFRQLFARAPRPPDAAKAATSPDTAPAPAADAGVEAAGATPATPALSIRNRRRRPASGPAEPASAPGESPSAAADAPAPASESAAAMAAATTATAPAPSPGAAPPAAMATPVVDTRVPGSAVAKAAGTERAGEVPPSAPGPPDTTVAPPENIDAAAAALVAAIPAPAPLAELPSAPARPAPSFAMARTDATRARRDHRTVAAASALALLLALQLLLAQRAVLAADPAWRPAISALCGMLRCTLPPWREPAAFTMLSRHVRPHPEAPGTLLIDASFRNDARWPQPWPRLELTLSDVNGRTVGARTFEAREYLDAMPAQSELAPGQAASLSLAVVEPAPDIVSFTFDFR